MKPSQLLKTILTLALALLALAGLMLLLGAWSLGAPTAQAQGGSIHYVAPGGNCGSVSPCYSSVQAAVDAASNGDEIRIATGTYNENVNLNKSLTLRGGYTTTDWTTSNPISYPTVLNGGGAGRVIVANTDGTNVTIENLEVTGGTGGIQIGDDQARNINATIRNCYIHDNDSTSAYPDNGGGIYAYINGGYTVRIEDCRISGNTGGIGGGIYAYADSNAIIRIERSRITGNTDSSSCASGYCSGGVEVAGPSGVPTLIFSGNVITGNTNHAASNGERGPVVNLSCDNCTVEDNIIAQNTGGGMYIRCLQGCPSLVVTGNRIWGNQGYHYLDLLAAGLAVQSEGGGLVSGNVITGNAITCYYCDNLAAGLHLRGSLTVRKNVITGNTLSTSRGWSDDDAATGVYARGNIVFENNLVADNQAASGLPFPTEAVMLATSNNTSCDASDAYTYRFAHNTVARNVNAPGVRVPAPPNSNCPATAYITNTIIYSHALGVEAASNSAAYVYNSILSNTTNFSGNVTVGAGVLYTNPLFLADGYHIAADSPAKDAGTGTGFDYDDIDGQPRLMGPTTDIGVDEAVYTASVRLDKTLQGGTAILPVQAGHPISYLLTVYNAPTSTWQADVRVVDRITSAYPLAGLSGIGGNANVSCQAGSSSITCTYLNVPTDTAYYATVVVTPAVPTAQSTQGFASADNLNIAIPDDGCDSNDYAEHTIAVNTSGAIQDVDVFIKNITHDYDGDLDIYIKGPDGTQVELSTDNGGSGDNYINTIFDDEAATSITAGSAPFTGRYKPEGSLSAFDGKDAQGNWTLRICDGAEYDTGTLNGWGLTLTLQSEITQTVSWVITDTASMEVLDAHDPITDDNTAGPVTVTVQYTPPKPDLWVDKSAPRFAKPNQTITYTLKWGNQGGADADNVVLTDTLPAEVNFVAADGNPVRNGRYLTWTLGTVNSGASGTYVITVTTLSGLQDGTVITNVAGIATSTSGDPVVNNTDVATTTIYQLGGVSLDFSKTSLTTAATPYPGQVLPNEIIYELEAYNDGQVDAQTTIVDSIPQGTEYVDGSAQILEGGGSVQYDPVDDEVVWTGNIPVGQSVKIRFRVKVVSCDGVQCGLIRNTATAKVSGISYVWESQVDIPVKCPDLYVDAQIPENVVFKPVGYHEYEVVVSYGNQGEHKAPGVEIEAKLQNADAHFASANPLPAEKKNPQDWVWRPGDLDVGSTGSFRILIYADKWNKNGYPLLLTIKTQPDWYECQDKQDDNEYDDTTYPMRVTLDKKGRMQFNPGAKGGPKLEMQYIIYTRYDNAHPQKPGIEKMRITDYWPAKFKLKDVQWVGHPMKQVTSTASGLSIQATEYISYHWENDYMVVEGSRIYGRLKGEAPAYSLTAGKKITNRVSLSATVKKDSEVIGVVTEPRVTATNEVPLLPPLIIYPQSGQWCNHDAEVPIEIVAQPSVTVTLWLRDDGSETPIAVDKTDAMGKANWTFYYGEERPAEFWVVAEDAQGHQAKSKTVRLDSRNVHWNPQTSYWEGVAKAGPLKGQWLKFEFRNSSGEYSTSGWQMPGVYGFWDTTVHIEPCPNVCPSGQRHEIVIEADGKEYTGTVKGRYLEFYVGSAHDVKIKSRCVDEQTGQVMSEQVNGGKILIDPDGYVFNVDKGGSYDPTTGMFSPIEAIPGVTVTCYVSMPEWGGWIPWPAHLYDQVNPQNTNATYSDGITTTGYFAFFTPPGLYYLEVEGIPGYQRWRSPVVEVITQIVHVNVPYTPWPDTAAVTVTLTPDGPDPAVVTVPVGSAVQWVSLLRDTDTITDLVNWTENPILRPLSALDPLQDARGFDAGYLEPGRVYRRQFKTPGTYTYTDAAGHTGKIIVTGGARIYLPVVLKDYGQ